MNEQSPVGNGITPLQQMVASCSGAVLTSLFVTPLDVVKIRLQAQKNPFPKEGTRLVCSNGAMDHVCVSSRAWYKAPHGHFNGTVDALVKITRAEGIGSLWSGLPPTLAMAVPATVVYFSCYDRLRSSLRARMGEEHAEAAPLLAGSAARVASATVVGPLELVRTQLQAERRLSYGRLAGRVGRAVRSEGWRSLWRGWGPTLLRDVPFSALYWYNYEKAKAWLSRDGTASSSSITFVSGAASGCVAAVVTSPFDVVKTRRQVELGDRWASVNAAASSSSSSSTLGVMKRIVAENGVGGLFAGVVPRVMKVAPACAIMISTYEFGKAYFHQRNQERTIDL